MSKTFECIDYRTARRLASHGWTIYSRDTGEGWQWNPECSARYIRRHFSANQSWIRYTITEWYRKPLPKVLTFRAVNEPWKWD